MPKKISADVLAQWHNIKNIGLNKDSLTAGSNKRVWWVCDKGHEWEAVIAERSRGSGCPYCSGRKVYLGFNDLVTKKPDLALQWHYSKNSDKTPEMFTEGSHFKAWWVCDKGHEWQAKINDRNNGTGCKICYENKFKDSQTTLIYTHPILAQEWSKKNNLNPDEISYGSNQKIWWVCDKGHEWQARVSDRAKGGNCPKCHKEKFYVNENSLYDTHPYLIEQWHPTLNGECSPKMVSKGSTFKAWWVCDKGHEWQAEIRDRTGKKSGCPYCASRRYVSKAEKEIANILINSGVEIITSDKNILKGKEIDIFIPSKMIAIEFNGIYWHTESNGKDKYYHYNKYIECKNNNIQLIQIWEDDWSRKKDLVISMIKYKLGLKDVEKIYARATIVHVVTKKEAKIFLNKNHIQGFSSSTNYIALKHDNNIVALMSFKKYANNIFYLTRYATSLQVVGGFSKLLKYFIKNFEYSEIVTFSDNMISNGNLYKNNGFDYDKELPPDYMYVVKGLREHKFNYRLSRFKKDSNLLWVDGLSESKLALLNKINKCWDAGKIRWVLK